LRAGALQQETEGLNAEAFLRHRHQTRNGDAQDASETPARVSADTRESPATAVGTNDRRKRAVPLQASEGKQYQLICACSCRATMLMTPASLLASVSAAILKAGALCLHAASLGVQTARQCACMTNIWHREPMATQPQKCSNGAALSDMDNILPEAGGQRPTMQQKQLQCSGFQLRSEVRVTFWAPQLHTCVRGMFGLPCQGWHVVVRRPGWVWGAAGHNSQKEGQVVVRRPGWVWGASDRGTAALQEGRW
jgi:hypothetical protein